jgi:hypothetical protein
MKQKSRLAVIGAEPGVDLAFPSSMQADVIVLSPLNHGTTRAGLLLAAWTMA